MADKNIGPEKSKFDAAVLHIRDQLIANHRSRPNGHDMSSIMGSSPFFVSEHRLERWNSSDICTDSQIRLEVKNRLTGEINYTQREDSGLKLGPSLMYADEDTNNMLSLRRKEKLTLQPSLSTNSEDQITKDAKTEQLMISRDERGNSNSFPSQCSLTPLNSFSYTIESEFIEKKKRLAEPVLRDFLTDEELAKDGPYVSISLGEDLQMQEKQNDANYSDQIKLDTLPVSSSNHEFDRIKTNWNVETRTSPCSKLESAQEDLLTALPNIAHDKSGQSSKLTDLRVFKQGELDASSFDGSDWSSQECAEDSDTFQGNSTKNVFVPDMQTIPNKISQKNKMLADTNQLNDTLRTGDIIKEVDIDNAATEKYDPVNKGDKDVHENKDKVVTIVGTLHSIEDTVTNPKNCTSTQLSKLISSQKVNSPKKTTCKFCNKLFKLRKDLKKHLKTHTGSIKYACSVCNSSFANRTLLKKHLLSHSDVKFFTCSECPVKCRSFAELKSHKRKHNKKAENFLCTECPYKSSRQKDLIKHMCTHSPEKVYKCQFCQFSSKRKYSLQRHLKTTHSSCQTAKCPLCHLDSNNVDDFKSHIAMHAMFRTSYCIICQAFFKRKTKLREHLLSHFADDNDGTCRKCGKTYTGGHEYILHLMKHKKSMSSDQEDKGSSQDSFPDVSTQSSLNQSLHKVSAVVDFKATNSKLIMDTPAMEAKLAQMSTVAARLADMTKVVTLLNEKSHVVFQLAEISTLATELAVMSGNVLHSYKNTYDVTKSPEGTAAPRSVDVSDFPEASTAEEEEEEGSSVVQNNKSAEVNKDEAVETADCSEEVEMQIQVDLNGDPISCVQKADPPCENNDPLQVKRVRRLHCVQCNLVFTDSRSLKRHLLCHDDVRPYSCARCGQTFRRNEHLKKHLVTHTDERPFKCTGCSYTAKTEHRLKIHMLSHSQNKTFFCNHCTYAARTNYELNHHMKRHEPRSCSQCSFVCFSKAELKKHVFTHSSFICGDCDFTTSDRAEYTKHTKKHSLVQHLCCELCGYSCDTMKKFKYHKLRHENKTPYQCTDCDYKCSSRASFDCHRLKHAGLKPFLCSFCGSSFRKTSHLNQHLLIHKEEKSFECGECGYSCRTKHNLKEHMMTHSGEKPFTCRFCSFSCRRNKVLQQHMCKHDNQVIMVPPLQMPTIPFSQLQIPLHMPLMPSVP